MTSSPADHPPGTIGVAAGEFLRFGGFVHSLIGVKMPPGTRFMMAQSLSVPENMNKIVAEMSGDWLWIQADDHRFPPDALVRLLDRDVDVVVPLILRRSPPFVPVVFSALTEDGYVPWRLEDLPTEGLVEVVCAGSGGMLVRRPVLEAIIEMQGHPRVFEVDAGDILAEDFVFCRKIVEAGFTIHCDVEVTMGHQGTFTVWPHNRDGSWAVGFDMGHDKTGKRSTFHIDPKEQI